MGGLGERGGADAAINLPVKTRSGDAPGRVGGPRGPFLLSTRVLAAAAPASRRAVSLRSLSFFFYSLAAFKELFLCVCFCLPAVCLLRPFPCPTQTKRTLTKVTARGLGWRSGSGSQKRCCRVGWS